MKKSILLLFLLTLLSFKGYSQIPVTPGSISGPTKSCTEDTVVYSVAAVANSTYYSWVLPVGCVKIAGDSSNIITVVYNNNFNGGTMTVSACNLQGCSPQRTRNIGLNLLPAPASISGDLDGICNSNREYFSANVVGAHYYDWMVTGAGASIIGSDSLINVNISISDSFSTGQLIVSAVNKCGIGTGRSVTIKGFPAQPGIISGEDTVCMGQVYEYGILTVAGTTNYIWTCPSNGTVLDGQGQKTIHMGFCWYNGTNQNITVKAANSCGQSSARILTPVVATDCR